jgi:hypothetical protein
MLQAYRLLLTVSIISGAIRLKTSFGVAAVASNGDMPAGIVVCGHGWLQMVLQTHLHDARHLFTKGAGRVRHDDANRLIGPGALSDIRHADGAGCRACGYRKKYTPDEEPDEEFRMKRLVCYFKYSF